MKHNPYSGYHWRGRYSQTASSPKWVQLGDTKMTRKPNDAELEKAKT